MNENSTPKKQNLKTIVLCLLAALLLIGGGFWLWQRQSRIEAEKQAELVKQQKIEEEQKKKEEEKKKQEEERRQKEEQFRQASADWNSSQNIENLKSLYSDPDRKEQADELTGSWYESLWNDPFGNLDAIAEAIAIRNVDSDLAGELNLLKSMIAKSGQDLKYSNLVYLITGGPDGQSQSTRVSTITLIPVLDREGLSFRVFGDNMEGGIVSTGAITRIDESVPYEEQGVCEIRMIEDTYPASYSDGKFIVNALCGSPQSFSHDGKPVQMIIDDQKMDVTYEMPVSDSNNEIRQGVMFLQN